MTERTYPYTAWVLKPSFKPAEVTIKHQYASWSTGEYEYAESGKVYHRSEVFATKQEAIARGWERAREASEKLNRMAKTLEKKRAALMKAEAEE